MDLTFSRRSFLKTSAAAAVLGGLSVVLAGCDDDDKSPAFKSYQLSSDSFTFRDGMKIMPTMVYSTGDSPYQNLLRLSVTAPNDRLITLYPGNFSAYQDKDLLRMCERFSGSGNVQSSYARVDSGETESILAVFEKSPSPVIFKFTYNNQSIKFKPGESDSERYLSTGIYTDKF